MKKVGKFRYDLNQVLYDYVVKVRSRFKRLGLIECVVNYLQKFMALYRWQ